MNIRVGCLALLAVTTLFIGAAEPPEELISGLGAEDFQKRETSQRKLLEWASDRVDSSAIVLFRLSRSSDDPEVRQRCYDVLKDLSDQDYLKDGRGFLGITMLPEVADVVGEENPRAVVKITDIIKNGPAEKFGLEVGDAIFAIDGERFAGEDVLKEFSGKITAKSPLDEALLGVKKGNGKVEEVRVVLAKHPGENLDLLPRNLHLLDERARDLHFEEFLKELDKKPR